MNKKLIGVIGFILILLVNPIVAQEEKVNTRIAIDPWEAEWPNEIIASEHPVGPLLVKSSDGNYSIEYNYSGPGETLDIPGYFGFTYFGSSWRIDTYGDGKMYPTSWFAYKEAGASAYTMGMLPYLDFVSPDKKKVLRFSFLRRLTGGEGYMAPIDVLKVEKMNI